MDISSLKRDSTKVQGGQWVDDIPGFGKARLRVRGLTSQTVVTLRSRKERSATRKERNADGSIKPEVSRRILSEVLHEAVLLEWDGFTDNGAAVPFDADLAKQWCIDPDYEPFQDAVVYAARVVDNGLADTQETVSGNSKRSSTGSSSGATAQTN